MSLFNRRRFLAPALSAALFLALCLPAAADESVGIAPASGSQTDTFVVSGSGIQPGSPLDINFVSPSGTVFSTAALNQPVTVDDDGTFNFGFVPATEFQGEYLGTWTAQVCGAGTNNCVSGTFNIGA